MINNVMDLLARFEGMEWTNVDAKSVTFSNGMTVSYKVEVSNVFLTEGSPFRALVEVRRGEGWYTYGCVTNEENRDVVKWFIIKNNENLIWNLESREGYGSANIEGFYLNHQY